jgi:hypothetical protein
MQKEIEKRQKEELSAALAEKLFSRAHRGAETLVDIQFFDFLILCFCIFLGFCITKIGSTPSLNSIRCKVWPREIHKVLA